MRCARHGRYNGCPLSYIQGARGIMTSTSTTTIDLTGKRALVTGGSRGIGAGITQRLLDAGASVVASARNETATSPEDATFIVGDVSTRAGARALAEAAVAAIGDIDILVKNAGGARVFGDGTFATPDEEWQDSVDTNYLSAVRLTAALAPSMVQRGGGSIINISSSAIRARPPGFLHYAAAKAAVETYSRGLAGELAAKNVRVNVISPGSVTTPGADEARAALADAFGTTPEALAASIPLGRNGEPRHIADAVLFLASDWSSWTTGQVFTIDGGEDVG
jgi:NAD(P)-dependent dehydrogenase (short-subunit alcohol dehydrogenase family)